MPVYGVVTVYEKQEVGLETEVAVIKGSLLSGKARTDPLSIAIAKKARVFRRVAIIRSCEVSLGLDLIMLCVEFSNRIHHDCEQSVCFIYES